MSVLHVTKNDFEEVVMGADKPVLLDFWAGWCGPCRMVAPILDDIAQEREDILVCKVDVDQEPELASRFQIMSIPTLMVIEGGEVRTRSAGAKPKAQILAML